MSYDLMVFERNAVPLAKKEFIEWYDAVTEWGEEHDYSNPGITTAGLQRWFMEMIQTFPAMNGEFAPSDKEIDKNKDMELYLTDYSIGRHMIYAAFAWPLSEEAYELTRRLASKHNVGFFDASGNEGDIILPNGEVIT